MTKPKPTSPIERMRETVRAYEEILATYRRIGVYGIECEPMPTIEEPTSSDRYIKIVIAKLAEKTIVQPAMRMFTDPERFGREVAVFESLLEIYERPAPLLRLREWVRESTRMCAARVTTAYSVGYAHPMAGLSVGAVFSYARGVEPIEFSELFMAQFERIKAENGVPWAQYLESLRRLR